MMKTKKWFDHPLISYGGPLLIFLLVIATALISQQEPPYSSVAIDLGFAQIAWYAIFILTGILLAAFFSYQEFRKIGWDVNILFDGILYAVPLAIVGARLYYVLFDPSPNYQTFLDVINITKGGLAIHGGVLITLVFMIFFTKKRKISFWALADIIMVGFLIGQIVGRWGNFMNQEAYGPIIESQFLLNVIPKFILDRMYILGGYHHPTFLYEGLWNFVGLVFLLVSRRKKWFKVGDMLGLYLMWYGLGRGLIIEPLRVLGHPNDALRLFGLPANILLSLGLFTLGGLILIIVNHYVVKDRPYYVELLAKGDTHD